METGCIGVGWGGENILGKGGPGLAVGQSWCLSGTAQTLNQSCLPGINLTCTSKLSLILFIIKDNNE